MNPNDPRSKHVFHYLDFVEHVRPRAFVLENVKALYANQRWRNVRDALVERANSLGYTTLLTLVNASHFGVPQNRERMLLIGVQDDLGTPVPPAPTTYSCPPSVREALAQLPPYKQPGNDSSCAARIVPAKTPILRKSPFAGMLFNGAGRPLNLDAPSLTLVASMGGCRTPIIDQRALESAETTPWVLEYHSRLLRGGAVVSEVPQFLRRLTVEEAAAIQTFPLETRWYGSQTAKYRQIGNAVPPRLALAIAEAVKQALSF
jgi:DNA (cytosine-5)-methyltransferase 1